MKSKLSTKPTKDEMIFIRLGSELKAKLQVLADKDSRNLSDYLRLQLMKMVK